MESKCQIVSILSDSLVIQLKGANRHELETLVKDTDYRIKLVKWTNKRSKSANNYCWELCSLIANEVGSSREEVYRQMLDSYGTAFDDFEPISQPSYVDMSECEDHYRKIGTHIEDGKLYIEYEKVKGSSKMDSKEMSRFIDGIIYEAQALGIETKPPNEIEAMKARWGEDEISLTK